MGTLYELATGQSSREGKIGERLSDTYVRKFKYLKGQPNEAYSLPTLTAIGIGSPLPGNPFVTCVSVDDSPEGESRLVRIFTYTYKTIAHTGGPAEQQQAPDVRPPNYSFNFGVDYVSTTSWLANPVVNGVGYVGAYTPNSEMVAGLEKPQLTGILRVKQFVIDDPAFANEYVGYVNDGLFEAGSFSAIARTLLFRGIDAQPAVESYQDMSYWGWNVTYEFAYRENRQVINTTLGDDADTQVEVNIGWDKAVPMTSRNVFCSTNVGAGFYDPLAFPLEHNRNGAIKTGPGPIGGKYFWAEDPNNPGNTVEDSTCRAMVAIPAVKGGFTQVPAGEPIPVNNDGSPRSRGRKPLVYRRGFHKETNFRVNLGLR